jgi:aspartyl-tRNA(Asn)/glutamyl-tRNA(Gln) amidotransferase subunit A
VNVPRRRPVVAGFDADLEADVAALLDRAAAPAHRAVFTCLTPALAMRQARQAAQRRNAGRALGLLDGRVVTWKDVFDIAGLPTTCGSRALPPQPASRDAACVQRLHAAGAICLGKTNLSEFAFSGLGLNPHFGTPTQRAPGTGRAHLVGGSSSGAATAVRAGFGDVALGTDTSGSIRVPAAWSGLAGFRPSQGRYPREGVARLATSLDTVGVIARRVADVVAVDAVLAAGAASVQAPPRIVLVENLLGPQVQPEVAGSVRRFAARLQAAGYPVELRRLPVFDRVHDAFRQHGTLVAAEAAVELAGFADDPRLDPFVRWRLQQARALPAGARETLLALRATYMAQLAAEAAGAFLLLPTTPRTAPALEDLGSLEATAQANALALRHTMPCSFLDMPGITLPCGHDGEGLPIGALLTCASGGDGPLLALAAELEARRIPME